MFITVKKVMVFLMFLFVGIISLQAQSALFARKGLNKATSFAREVAQDIAANKKTLTKEGLKWGGFSGLWYLGLDKLKNLEPDDSVVIPQDVSDSVSKEAGVLEGKKIIPLSNSYLDNRNNPENRWLVNGKGFWRNIIGLFPVSDFYVDKDENIRITPGFAQKIHDKDKEALAEFHEKLQDQILRVKDNFDYKTYAACATDTALLTPFFMISPIARFLQTTTKLQKAPEFLSYIASASGNKAIRDIRENSK